MKYSDCPKCNEKALYIHMKDNALIGAICTACKSQFTPMEDADTTVSPCICQRVNPAFKGELNNSNFKENLDHLFTDLVHGHIPVLDVDRYSIDF